MKFNRKYFIAFLVILFVELIIALYIKDNFIRPFIGDVLVIALMYSFIRSFTNMFKHLPIYLFIFAALVELSQYFNVIKYLGLQNNRLACVILGRTFDYNDLACYFVGMIICFIWQKKSKLMEY